MPYSRLIQQAFVVMPELRLCRVELRLDQAKSTITIMRACQSRGYTSQSMPTLTWQKPSIWSQTRSTVSQNRPSTLD